MSGPEVLLLEAARRDTRTTNTTQLIAYAESEGADPGPLFEAPVRAHPNGSAEPVDPGRGRRGPEHEGRGGAIGDAPRAVDRAHGRESPA